MNVFLNFPSFLIPQTRLIHAGMLGLLGIHSLDSVKKESCLNFEDSLAECLNLFNGTLEEVIRFIFKKIRRNFFRQ